MESKDNDEKVKVVGPGKVRVGERKPVGQRYM